MRFVKASERLPELDTILCLKFKGFYCSGQFNSRYGKLECDIAWRGTYLEASFDLIEWLDESLPTSLEREAEKLYPYHPQNDEMYTDSMVTNIQRSAHITAARQYMGEIDKERKEAKIELLWELIEDWQGARDIGEDINAPKFSFNDIEVDFYEKLEQIDPSVKK